MVSQSAAVPSDRNVRIHPESLHTALEQRTFKPCAGLDTHSMGWAAPAGRESTQLVHAGNGRMMVCLRREDRILPAAVVREQVEEKAEAIGLAESRPVGRKEKQRIKDEVITDLLPRAFTRSSHQYAYIDQQAGWVVVDSGTAKRPRSCWACCARPWAACGSGRSPSTVHQPPC
ncbi:MAG: recombination-associated protein RdgC [Chromatiaceae bacterium]|nr:recombination-associated protein RdgC [Chromatiaceae bacterium]